MTLYERYFADRASYLESIKMLEKKHGLTLLQHLVKENIVSQFQSKITEINFGIFLDNLCKNLVNEKVLGGKTPDWTVEMNGQSVVFEVLRLNPNEKDKKELDFQDALMGSFKQIPVGCFLYFDYDDTTFDPEVINILHCKEEIMDWLSFPRKDGETILLQEIIQVEFAGYRESVNYACLSGGGGSIRFDYRRLQYALKKKMVAYSDLIAEEKSPFIICIYLDFHSWFQVDDIYRHLYGLSTENRMHGLTYYSHWIERGIYYDPERSMRHVSGILACQNGRYTYFHNYIGSNLLSAGNTSTLQQWQHPYE